MAWFQEARALHRRWRRWEHQSPSIAVARSSLAVTRLANMASSDKAPRQPVWPTCKSSSWVTNFPLSFHSLSPASSSRPLRDLSHPPRLQPNACPRRVTIPGTCLPARRPHSGVPPASLNVPCLLPCTRWYLQCGAMGRQCGGTDPTEIAQISTRRSRECGMRQHADSTERKDRNEVAHYPDSTPLCRGCHHTVRQ